MLPSRNARAHLDSATFPELLLLEAHLIWKGEMKGLSGWGLLKHFKTESIKWPYLNQGWGEAGEADRNTISWCHHSLE